MHTELTQDTVNASDIAEARGLKTYKVKAGVTQARDTLSKGMVIWKYAEYIQDSFPSESTSLGDPTPQTVNENEDQVYRILLKVFSLSRHQQDKFWDSARYKAWAERGEVTYSLLELSQALSQVKLNTV